MHKSQRILQALWTLLLGAAFTGFAQAPASVGWLLASIAALVPLCISLALNGPQWDRSFLGIAVYSLGFVAMAVCLGQWAVLNASPAELALMPFCSLLLWFVHERKRTPQGQ